ncbi:MAG: helix-turn-helix domain-containing protein [Candidatus Binataceae bacterium]
MTQFMSEEPTEPKFKRLLSIEFQTEVDVPTARPERRMFLKMYFDARDSGLLAAIGDRRWRTLCTLATYMDENGLCYPSQARIAKDLAIHRQRVNERIQELLEFTFQGRAIITVKKARLMTQNGGRWANNVYQILPVAGLRIFGDDTSQASDAPKPPQNEASPYVRKSGQRPVSAKPDTGNPDTNQNQFLTRSFNVMSNSYLQNKRSESPTEESATRAALEQYGLVTEILETCGDRHSRGFYRLIAKKVPHQLIRAALSETRYRAATGGIKRSRGALFTAEVIRLAKEHGIYLDAKPNEPA